jgi:hypothetical protein
MCGREDETRPHSDSGYLIRERLQTPQHPQTATRLIREQARERPSIIGTRSRSQVVGRDSRQASNIGCGHKAIKRAECPRKESLTQDFRSKRQAIADPLDSKHAGRWIPPNYRPDLRRLLLGDGNKRPSFTTTSRHRHKIQCLTMQAIPEHTDQIKGVPTDGPPLPFVLPDRCQHDEGS